MGLDKIGILIFDGVELLDFAGPMQVFSSFQYVYPELCKSVITIGLSDPISVSKTQLKITPHQTIDEATDLDLFIIPGGAGTRSIIKNEAQLKKIAEVSHLTEIVGSVCTGSLVLAKLGMLSGLKATTHFAAVDLLSSLDPTIEVDRTKRYHDHDRIIVSEGVSAGIDMSLYLISKHYSQEHADQVKKYIEYNPE